MEVEVCFQESFVLGFRTLKVRWWLVAGAIQEFVGFGGLGSAINLIELKFLNLLHIESFLC